MVFILESLLCSGTKKGANYFLKYLQNLKSIIQILFVEIYKPNSKENKDKSVNNKKMLLFANVFRCLKDDIFICNNLFVLYPENGFGMLAFNHP